MKIYRLILILFGVILAICLLFAIQHVKAEVIDSGAKTVTSAGTAERVVSTALPVRWVDVQADCGNTDSVFVGGSTVSSTVGVELTPCAMTTFIEFGKGRTNLRNIWVDVVVNGEGIVFNYLTWP